MVDFIGIGAQKAGTTWLWEMLRQHPGVYFGPVKEVHYFDVVHLGASRARRLAVTEHAVDQFVSEQRAAHVPQDRIERALRLKEASFAFTDPWYEAIFADAPAGARSGDITPLYCALPDAGIAHVRRVAPGAKLIYMIRDPIERGISSVRQLVNAEKSVERVLRSKHFLPRGDYRSNIPRWDRHSSPDQLLFVAFGDIKRDPQGVLREVERHLGLEPFEGYQGMNVPRRSTTEKGVVLPPGIEQRIEDIFAGQSEYLLERFGPDFVSRIA